MQRHPHWRQRLLVILLLVLVGIAWYWRPGIFRHRPAETGPQLRDLDPVWLAHQLDELQARERELDATLWAPEMLAQQASKVVEQFWDSLNASHDRWQVVKALRFGQLRIPELGLKSSLPHGIEVWAALSNAEVWPLAQWRDYVTGVETAGWRLSQSEFRHYRFDPMPTGDAARSVFSFTVNLVQANRTERVAVTGELEIAWADLRLGDNHPTIREITASGIELRRRTGPLPFVEILNTEVFPPAKSFFIDPLLVHDLDGDGRSEIILASANRVWKLLPGNQFIERPLCEPPPGAIFTAVLGDFDRDGLDDLVAARFEGLVLYPGTTNGSFNLPPRPAWKAVSRLRYGQVLTSGDVDGDGDLDLWLGQYKLPYERGQMPTPVYNANDGYPAYLLLNDGRGRFTDVTEPAGLAHHRTRRTYSASLVDLDHDGDLDLLTVSDFAGVDLHANNGHGRFRDVTGEWLTEPHAFGMSHTLGDYDGDGELDFLVMGMHCPTPWRLHHLGLERSDRPDYGGMLIRMAAGNRLYCSRPGPRFESTSLNASIARSGWSWGCTTFDLDNDGFADVYIGNGHETKASVRDYEPQFWLHDIYVGDSRNNPVAQAYFMTVYQQTRAVGQSYGGYEKNRLFWNQSGQGFIDIGHLLGVALQEDCRNVVADDLDGDGRMDLIVTTFEAWPQVRQTLRVFQNRLEPVGPWIAARLDTRGARTPAVGAVITLETAGRRFIRPVVTGDSHRSQHPPIAHFGLGTNRVVDRLEVHWPNGLTTSRDHPNINTIHVFRPEHGE